MQSALISFEFVMYSNAMTRVTLRNYKPGARIIDRSTADIVIKLEIISVVYILTRWHWDCTTLKHFCIAWGVTAGSIFIHFAPYSDTNLLYPDIIDVSNHGHLPFVKLSHICTVVMKGGVISMANGVHVDNDFIPSL